MWLRLVLENKTCSTLTLRELQQHAVNGYYGHTTRLGPLDVHYNFPATIYQDRNRDSGRASEVLVFIGEREAEESLSPETFPQFVKLIFEMDGPDHLLIYGIRPRGRDIFRRLSGFGFLGGRDYIGRNMELILRTRILQVGNLN